jgi:hypothetical protein
MRKFAILLCATVFLSVTVRTQTCSSVGQFFPNFSSHEPLSWNFKILRTPSHFFDLFISRLYKNSYKVNAEVLVLITNHNHEIKYHLHKNNQLLKQACSGMKNCLNEENVEILQGKYIKTSGFSHKIRQSVRMICRFLFQNSLPIKTCFLTFINRCYITNRLVKNNSFPLTRIVYRSFTFLGRRLKSYDGIEIHKNWLSFLDLFTWHKYIAQHLKKQLSLFHITQKSVFIWLCPFINLSHYMFRSKIDNLQVHLIIFIISSHFIYVYVRTCVIKV